MAQVYVVVDTQSPLDIHADKTHASFPAMADVLPGTQRRLDPTSPTPVHTTISPGEPQGVPKEVNTDIYKKGSVSAPL